MNDQSLSPRFIEGLYKGLFTIESNHTPSLAQEINELFAGKKLASAFRKLAEIMPGTYVRVLVPEKYHTPLLPSGTYGFEVGSEAEWKTPLLIESIAFGYIDDVTASPISLGEIAKCAVAENAPEDKAARMALARLVGPALASVFAIAHRKQHLQVYSGTSSPVMIPAELLANYLILRRYLDPGFSDAVQKQQDRLQELAFQETSQEIALGIGFRMEPCFQSSSGPAQLATLQQAYVTAAWAFSSELVHIIDPTPYTDQSQARKLWRRSASLLNQIDSLHSEDVNTTSIQAPAQSPIVKRWTSSYKWSLSWGMVALVVALVLKVKPLFDVGDSAVLSVVTSTVVLASVAPIVFHFLDGLGYYNILMTLATFMVSLWVIIETIGPDRTVRDQTTWIWLLVFPLMLIFDIFRDREATQVQTEEWRKGVV